MINIDIEEDIKCANDIVYFIEKYVYIDGAKVKLKEFQKDVLKDDIMMNKKARQLGFTMMSVLKMVHTVIFNTNRVILYTSVRYMNGVDILSLFEKVYNDCTYPSKPIMTTNNKSTKIFDNFNKIILSTYHSNNIRGYFITDVYLDEYDFIKKEEFEEYIICLIPSIHNKNTIFWMFSSKFHKNYKSKVIPRKIKRNTQQYDYWVSNDELYLKYKNLVNQLSKKVVYDEYGLTLKMRG